MSTVYVIGAGASHGELLKPLPGLATVSLGHPPPMISGFFDKDLLDSLRYLEAEHEFRELIPHIRAARLLGDPFGEGAWKNLNLEEILTAVEIEREFQNPESDPGASLLVVRNGLIRYIRRIIGLCTQNTYGEYYRKLVTALKANDSIITFNWDLLLDQEFIPMGMIRGCYSNLLRKVRPTDRWLDDHLQYDQTDGLFLKLHGSLNWYRCGNPKCPESFAFLMDTQPCLFVCTGNTDSSCERCGSEMNPIIVPPVLRKSITEDPVIRSAWGLAWRKLREASRVVVIGFSAAPTDFYTSWLLRSTVGVREHVRIDVINPCNPNAGCARDENNDFTQRMRSIFLRDYDFSLRYFSQIESVLGS